VHASQQTLELAQGDSREDKSDGDTDNQAPWRLGFTQRIPVDDDPRPPTSPAE